MMRRSFLFVHLVDLRRLPRVVLFVMAILAARTELLSAAEELSGRDIIEAQRKQQRVPYETTEITMILVDHSGNRESRKLKRLTRQETDGRERTLTIFTAPSDIRGSALLTHETENTVNDQWFYFPSRQRLQRISQGNRNNYFMGSDFTYEDLSSYDIDAFRFSKPRIVSYQGEECYVIDVHPGSEKDAQESGYSFRRLWIRKDILFTVKIEFYDRQQDLAKTQVNQDLQHLGSGVWRAGKMFMDNLAKHHQTAMVMTAIDTTREIPAVAFSEQFLTTGRHLE